MTGTTAVLALIALACALASAVILVGYLVRRPALTSRTKIWLFMGLGPLSIGAAVSGNAADFEQSKKREFCGSCHVMTPYIRDAEAMTNPSISAVHTRTKWFGDESCYVCHADYGMFGAVTTKLGGLRHVWDYYTKDWDGPGARKPELYRPYSTNTCTQCHSLGGASLARPLEHRLHQDALGRGDASCVSKGCHGPSHRGVHEAEKRADAIAPRSSQGEPSP